MLERADKLARHFGLMHYGSEVAKATSIVYSEYGKDHMAALRVLDEAAKVFGDSPTIRAQRINALFQVNDDALALKLWEPLAADPESSKYFSA